MNKPPKGWHLSGSSKQHYEIGIDSEVKFAGKSSGYINSSFESDGFGTLMQSFQPSKTYVSKRLKMSAQIKTENISKWAGLWMRIDGINDQELGFDNMQNRPIKGTNVWKTYEVVLDVPSNVSIIAFGVLLVGKGKVWIDAVKFEIVDNTYTGTDMSKNIPKEPINLDFEESGTE